MEKARLDKIIAAGGRYSRREVRQLIRRPGLRPYSRFFAHSQALCSYMEQPDLL